MSRTILTRFAFWVAMIAIAPVVFAGVTWMLIFGEEEKEEDCCDY